MPLNTQSRSAKPVEEPKAAPKAAAKPARKQRAPKSDGTVYIATESGSAQAPDGETFVFVKGVTRVRDGHRLLKIAGAYFEPVDDHVHYDVEQATAAPGEKR